MTDAGRSPGTITGIAATEVIVPAHPGAVTSEGLYRPLHKLPSAATEAYSIQFDELPKLVLQLRLADGTVGLGELYRDHDWATVDGIAARLLGKDIQSLTLQALPFHHGREYDGFEIALYDAYARRHGIRVVDLFGGPIRTRVQVSAWSGQRYLDDYGPMAAKFATLGHTTIKLKCDANDDIVGWCERIAEAAPGMAVILDPNERLDHLFLARSLASRLESIGNVLLLEDPLPHWQLEDWALLRQVTSIPIVRHIAMGYPSLGNRRSDALTAIRHGTVDGFNLTAGLVEYARLNAVATLADLPTFHGSEVDLGILEAAYLHAACAAASCTWPSDIFGRLIRSHDLLSAPLASEPPYLLLPEGPGLGIALDEDALSDHARARRDYSL
jgi:muconate cycloisomerase